MKDIQQKTSYRLGSRTLFFFIIQRAIAGIIILVMALIMAELKGILLGSDVIASFALIINWVILFLLSIGLLTLVLSVIIARLQYGISTIMIDDASLHIIQGILSKEELAIPYRRIQSVEIKQSFLYRLLGVAHMAIATTTSLEQPSQIKSESNEEVIPTIDYQLALAIEKILTGQAEVERMEVEK